MDSTEYINPLIFALDGVLADYLRAKEERAATTNGKTFAFDWRQGRFLLNNGDLVTVVDQECLLEDVIKMLLTPRFLVPIYSSKYGADFHAYVGTDMQDAPVIAESIINDTLLVDSRIEKVIDFEVVDATAGVLTVKFSVVDYAGRRLEVPTILVRYG